MWVDFGRNQPAIGTQRVAVTTARLRTACEPALFALDARCFGLVPPVGRHQARDPRAFLERRLDPFDRQQDGIGTSHRPAGTRRLTAEKGPRT
jgi:hypothetical protein